MTRSAQPPDEPPPCWLVLAGSLASIIAYGLYRGRGGNIVDRYLLAGKTMPW